MALFRRNLQWQTAGRRDFVQPSQTADREIPDIRQPHQEMAGPGFEVLMATIAASLTSPCNMETLTSLIFRPVGAGAVKVGPAAMAEFLPGVARADRVDQAILVTARCNPEGAVGAA